jgi:hypothetical protein
MHYACDGECGGVSDEPGQCQAESCSRHGEDLSACDCEDGLHGKGAANGVPKGGPESEPEPEAN